MTAVQIIEEIKRLPKDELIKVIAFAKLAGAHDPLSPEKRASWRGEWLKQRVLQTLTDSKGRSLADSAATNCKELSRAACAQSPRPHETFLLPHFAMAKYYLCS